MPDRPYIDLYWPKLAELVEENFDNIDMLRLLLYELGFRYRAGAKRIRERVIVQINQLDDQRFTWPTTAAPVGNGTINVNGWPKAGLLSALGYCVGTNGSDINARRQILDSVYEGTLPNVNSREYMAEWGQPQTGNRLNKLADSLASFCRMKKRSDPRAQSVSDWESDLEYLKKKFYVGRYNFGWPNTQLL